MTKADHAGWDETRKLQSDAQVVKDNHANLVRWGAHNIVKVTAVDRPLRGKPPLAFGYLTLLPAVSGHTPLKMQDLLGLKKGALETGALVYRLLKLPREDQIEVRGYTTLVDGVALKPGLKADHDGYRPGWGAYQVRLKDGVTLPAELVATLGPHTPYRPPVHPDVAKLYPPGHPARGGH